jgi:hypothetical protein
MLPFGVPKVHAKIVGVMGTAAFYQGQSFESNEAAERGYESRQAARRIAKGFAEQYRSGPSCQRQRMTWAAGFHAIALLRYPPTGGVLDIVKGEGEGEGDFAILPVSDLWQEGEARDASFKEREVTEIRECASGLPMAGRAYISWAPPPADSAIRTVGKMVDSRRDLDGFLVKCH